MTDKPTLKTSGTTDQGYSYSYAPMGLDWRLSKEALDELVEQIEPPADLEVDVQFFFCPTEPDSFIYAVRQPDRVMMLHLPIYGLQEALAEHMTPSLAAKTINACRPFIECYAPESASTTVH